MQPINILLLCDEAARHTGTVDQHIRAFQNHSDNRVIVLDSRAASGVNVNLELFDVVVFHYSIVISMLAFLPQPLYARLTEFQGTKILFIQDEYRWVDRTAAAARDLGVSVVFTVVNRDVIRVIYRDPWFNSVRFEQTLTGFVPEELIDRSVPDYSARQFDVSYRARRVPSWLGEFGQDKWIIGERFKREASTYRLRCDIEMSEHSRIYGDAWIEFVANSRAVLGTESGASYIDFTGDAKQKVEAYETANPGTKFDEIQTRFLTGDGQNIIHVISPRCFEAAALRTLMVLYPGDYSGLLQAGRHYVALAQDHSNMDEVVAILKDETRARPIIEAAFNEVAKSPDLTFKALIKRFDLVVAEELEKTQFGKPAMIESRRKTLADRNIDDVFADIKRSAVYLTRKRRLAMSSALALQRASSRLRYVVATKLPQPVARLLLCAGRAAKSAAKPLVKRLLIGRSE